MLSVWVNCPIRELALLVVVIGPFISISFPPLSSAKPVRASNVPLFGSSWGTPANRAFVLGFMGLDA